MIKTLAVIALVSLTGCNDADVASRNISQAADNFEISRRVIFYNGINGEYMLTIEGLCSLDKASGLTAVTVTCKTGPKAYKKHYLGLSDNVTYFAEQVEGANVSPYHYRVLFQAVRHYPRHRDPLSS